MLLDIFWYESPLGAIILADDRAHLTGLWFEGQKYCAAGLAPAEAARARTASVPGSPVLVDACRWLDRYFAGFDPCATPALQPVGTPFQRAVWEELRRIPYGRTTTYGELARRLEPRLGRSTSARAVGAAVGRNPISIMIPCHRVLAADGGLTGYAGGLSRKRALLALER